MVSTAVASGERIPGKRVYPEPRDGASWLALGDKGAYGKDEFGCWWAHAPRGPVGALDDHQVTEHPDGTISVSPSIEWGTPWNWHGYLRNGVWEEVVG